MVSSQRNKRLYLVVGLMILLVLGLLWHAGMLMQGSRSARKDARRPDAKTLALQPHPVVVTKRISASVADEAHAAEGQPSAVIRKKLPPLPLPGPIVEPQPAAPAPEPVTVVQEKPKEPPAPETAPAIAVTPPATGAPAGPPEKPTEVQPAAVAPPAFAPAPVVPPAPSMAQAAPAPSKKPEPAPSVAKAVARARSSYPFSLLLSSNRLRENALTTLPGYQRMGLSPYIVHTDLGEKGMWWRTLIGHYKSLKDALQAKNSLKIDDAAVVKTPFANLVGDYPSEREAAEASVRLAQKGLFPYVVKGPGDTARVLVGAFPAQAAAEQQQHELEGMGIMARTIRR
jgi:cell division septation protein DedD